MTSRRMVRELNFSFLICYSGVVSVCCVFVNRLNTNTFFSGISQLLKQASSQKVYNGLQGY